MQTTLWYINWSDYFFPPRHIHLHTTVRISNKYAFTKYHVHYLSYGICLILLFIMNEQTVVQSHNEILLCNEKRMNISSKMDDPQTYCAKCKKPGWKGYLMYHSITWHSRKGKTMATEGRPVVGKGYAGRWNWVAWEKHRPVRILIAGVVTWLRAFVKTHETVTLRVNFTVSKYKKTTTDLKKS